MNVLTQEFIRTENNKNMEVEVKKNIQNNKNTASKVIILKRKLKDEERILVQVGAIAGAVSDVSPSGDFRDNQLASPEAFLSPEKGDLIDSQISCELARYRKVNCKEKVLFKNTQGKLPWCAAEFMCGLASLSTAFSEMGVGIGGLCEKQAGLLETVASQFPGVCRSLDINLGDWRDWVAPGRFEVVMGGPVCNPFSTAGKREGPKHEGSNQVFLMVDAAVGLGARWLLIENVPNLLEQFGPFFEQFVSDCRQKGWVFLGAELLNHADLGGASRRTRIWPLFEVKAVAGRLPPWCPWRSAVGGSSLRLLLDTVAEVKEKPRLKGSFNMYPKIVVGASGVLRVGDFWMGDCDPIAVQRGHVVQLKPDREDLIYAKHRGAEVTLCAATEKFVVLEVKDSRVRLLHDERAGPIWLWRAIAKISRVCKSCTPVYGLDGPGPTVRSMRVPPAENGFLVVDDRLVPPVVRPVSGSEIWRIQGLSMSLAELLRESAIDWDQLGEMAGSSIPGEMCKVQAGRLCSRVEKLRELECLEAGSFVPWLDHCAPSVAGVFRVKLMLCVVLVSTECMLLVDEAGAALPGMCFEVTVLGDSCVLVAERWAEALLGSKHLGFLAAERVELGCTVKLVVVPTKSEIVRRDLGMRWASVSELMHKDPGMGDILLVSAARIASFRRGVHTMGPLAVRGREVTQKRFKWCEKDNGLWKEGRTPIMFVEPESLCGEDGASLLDWEAALQELRDNQETLRARLRAVESDHPAFAWLQETADVMKPLETADVPMELLRCGMGEVQRQRIVDMPMPEDFKPPVTEWLPRKVQLQSPPVGFEPRSLSDLIGTEGMKKISAWQAGAMRDLMRMREMGSAARRSHTEVLVLCQEDLVPEARGVVWDLRGASGGVVVPLDFGAPLETHLNLEYLRKQSESGMLVDYPDQQLMSQLLLGVRYRDALDMQIVLLPHLISFGDGCVEIQREMEGLVGLGWYSLHSELPFIPFRNIPRGSTLKTDGTARPTSEVGAPRKPVFDRMGRPVVPQNDAIGAVHWEKEHKPTMGLFMQALVLLLSMAKHTGEPLFMFSDDLHKCFNQLKLAPEQYWKANSLLAKADGEAMWASECVMPFGVKCGSNIAQGWAHLIMHLVRITMDEMEVAAGEGNTVLSALLQDRKVKWVQKEGGRAYFSVMYTDDSATAVVGVERMVRYLCAWFEVTTRMAIIMAPPRKRQLGCRLQWVGGIVLATGIITIGLQKRVRAIQELKRLLAGKLSISALRKLLGLLEHFVFILALKRNTVAALYEPFSLESEAEDPDRKVTPSEGMCSTAARLVKFVAEKAGSLAAHFATEYKPLAFDSGVISWHSDAAREKHFKAHFDSLQVVEGDQVGIGLGGYSAGYWWNWPLSEEAHQLHIGALEALAYALNFFVFGPLFVDIVGSKTALLTHCDALASVLGVAFGRSKSKLLVFVFEGLEKIPAFKKMKPHTAITHVAGPGNLLADAASRGRIQVIRDFTAQLGVKPIRRKLPRRALSFLHEAVAYARTLTDVEQDLAVGMANTPDSASFVSREIPRMVSDEGVVVRVGQSPRSIHVGSTRIGATQRGIPRMVSEAGIIVSQSNSVVKEIVEPRMVIEDSGRGNKSLFLKVVRPAAEVVGEPTVKRLTALQQGRRDVLIGLSSAVAEGVAATLRLEPCLQQSGLKVDEMMQGMFHSVLEAVPEGTKIIDARDWELWCGVMSELNVAPWRGDVAAHMGHDAAGYWREVVLQAIAYYRCLKMAKPRKRKLNAEGGLIPAKPESVSVIKSVRRIHKYFGVQMAESRLYGMILKAANVKFIEENGLSALMPHRKEPFTNLEIQRMIKVQRGVLISGKLVSDTSRFWRSVDLLIKVMAQTGFRLGDALKMNRDSVMFDFMGRILPMTGEQMRPHLTAGVFAIMTPQRTKSDPLGIFWSPFPVYLNAGEDDNIGAGRALFLYDLDFAVELSTRHKEPLFTDDKGARLTRPSLERLLRELLLFVGVDPESHSWHSFRIYLAVALKQAGADDARIKAMVRWVSDKSLRIYARDSKDEYTKWLQKASEAEVSTVYVQSLPEIDEDQVMAALDELLKKDLEG